MHRRRVLWRRNPRGTEELLYEYEYEYGEEERVRSMFLGNVPRLMSNPEDGHGGVNNPIQHRKAQVRVSAPTCDNVPSSTEYNKLASH
jgi:hypothetical protein